MTSNVLEQETISNILDRKRRAARICEPWHNEIKRWRNIYNFKHYRSRAKTNETQYPDPTPTNTVDITVNILSSRPLEFRATGWNPSFEEQDATEKVEKFLNGAIDLANSREDMLIPYHVNLHMARDGCAVIKSVWDPYYATRHSFVAEIPNPEATPEQPAAIPMRGFREIPLKTEVIDPLEIFVVPGGRQRWLYLFHVTKMSVHDAQALYNFVDSDYIGRENDALYIKHELVDYWRVAHHTEGDVIINGVMFNEKFIPGFTPKVMQGYDDLPFSLGFFKPVDPKNPRDWGHGVIRPLEPSIALMERNINRVQRQIDVYSSMPMVIKALPGRQVSVDAGFGKTLNMSIDEEISFPKWPGNAPDSARQIDFLRSRIQQSGFSDILYGLEGTGAGFAISQMTDQNRIRLIAPIYQIELLWTKWAEKALRLVRSFASNSLIRVYGVLNGDNFSDQVIGAEIADYRVKAKIKAEFPNQQVVNAALSTQSADVLSFRTRAERFWDIDQPGDEWDQKMLERVERHPAMIEYGLILGFMKKAKLGDQAAIMVLEKMQKGPIQESPEQGVNPEQSQGGFGPTNEPPPQATGNPPPGQSEQEMAERRANASVNMRGGVG